MQLHEFNYVYKLSQHTLNICELFHIQFYTKRKKKPTFIELLLKMHSEIFRSKHIDSL